MLRMNLLQPLAGNVSVDLCRGDIRVALQHLHHALVTHEDGRRLAKRDRAPTLAAMREAGVDGRALANQLRRGELPLGFRFSEA